MIIMTKEKKPLLRRHHLNVWLTVPAFIIIGAGVLFTGMAIAPGHVSDAVDVFLAQPMLILLNALPVFALLAVLWMAFGNLFASGAVTLAVTDILAYINLLKIDGRDDPFIPADIFLLREGVTAVGEYELKQYPVYIAIAVVGVTVLSALAVLFTTARPKPLLRGITAVILAGAFVATVPTLYADKELYGSFKVPNQYNITGVFNTLGFNYCFLHNFNMYPVDKPEGYSTGEVEAWYAEDAAEERDSEVRPNVIFIMCEAFSDVANDPSMDYPDGRVHPLSAYNELRASDRAYSGHIIVSNYGAGTANTEFDVLTGLPTLMLSAKTTSAFRTVRRGLNTVPRMFAAEGYSTYFMHPGASWFYNRSSVYSYFGMQEMVFLDDAFTTDDYKGGKVSDAAFLRVLKGDLERKLAEDEPLFAYTVTIQNHQAYATWKYADKTILDGVPTSKEMTLEDRQTLNVYLHGLADSDAMLRGLTDYLDTVDEPTLLVFFGDHRPTLGVDYSVYRALGMNVGNALGAEDMISTNKAPLLLWANEAYGDDFKASLGKLELPESGMISDHYLGAAVSELIGYAGKDAYYDFLNAARRTLPVVCGGAYMDADGECKTELSEEEQEIVTKTHAYLYWRMKEQKLLGE